MDALLAYTPKLCDNRDITEEAACQVLSGAPEVYNASRKHSIASMSFPLSGTISLNYGNINGFF